MRLICFLDYFIFHILATSSIPLHDVEEEINQEEDDDEDDAHGSDVDNESGDNSNQNNGIIIGSISVVILIIGILLSYYGYRRKNRRISIPEIDSQLGKY